MNLLRICAMPSSRKSRRRAAAESAADLSDFPETSPSSVPPAWLRPMLQQLAEDGRRRDAELLDKLTECGFSGQPTSTPSAPGRHCQSTAGADSCGGVDTDDQLADESSGKMLKVLPNAKPPSPLGTGVSLREFCGWQACWADYATLIRLDTFSRREQLAQFRTCLTADMRATLEHVVGADSLCTVDEMLDGIHEYLLEPTQCGCGPGRVR